MESFAAFFRQATGFLPYGFQVRMASSGLPAQVRAPAGTGKTGIVLAWLWRRLVSEEAAATPRRLIYALPPRSLVDPLAEQVSGWLARLGRSDEVALHAVMGGDGTTYGQWRHDMHRPAIVIGTTDALVSKALNRGMGIGRAVCPIDFALVTNGAHWVIDELGFCQAAAATLHQLAALAGAVGTAEPFGLTFMTATGAALPPGGPDREQPGLSAVAGIEPSDLTGELAVRLAARRVVSRLPARPGAYRAMAAEVARLHRPGTLTLVVLNTVAAARQVHAELPDGPATRTLIHPRFRGRERQALGRLVCDAPGGGGRIVVATQIADAGMDLDAAVLVTEAAPWPFVIRRAGQCNRSGLIDGARMYWVQPAAAGPYQEQDVARSVAALRGLDGVAVTSEDLLSRDVVAGRQDAARLGGRDLARLFDTASWPEAADPDLMRYLGDADDLDAQLIWAIWSPEPSSGGGPPEDARIPGEAWRCQVPLAELAGLAARIPLWRIDPVSGGWARVTLAEPARPGEVLVAAAEDGGYDPVTGFDPAVGAPVPGCPVLIPRPELAPEPAKADQGDEPAGWVSLLDHSVDTRDHAAALLSALAPALSGPASRAVLSAAYAHDAGKAHEIWQDALCALAAEHDEDVILAGRPWAKSGREGRLRFAGDLPFRHEFASLLLVDGPLRALLDDAGDRDLARYLILAHHGRLRVRVPAGGRDREGYGTLLGLEQDSVWRMPPMLGQPACELRVDLGEFGADQSWTRTVLSLAERYGPFVLAYLETIVRVADWRASARSEPAS